MAELPSPRAIYERGRAIAKELLEEDPAVATTTVQVSVVEILIHLSRDSKDRRKRYEALSKKFYDLLLMAGEMEEFK